MALEQAAPPPVVAPLGPPPCPDAASLRARAGAMLRAGRLDRTLRVLERYAQRCPAEAAVSADLLASARATLEGLIGDPDELLDRALSADERGDSSTAR